MTARGPADTPEQTLAKQEGCDSWWQALHFHGKEKWSMDENLPQTFPWVVTKVLTTERIYERNPYYWMVDVEGNSAAFAFNLTHKDPVLREIFNDIRFRQANDLAMYQTIGMRFVPAWGEFGSGELWVSWYESGGKSGEEPPAEIKKLYELRDQFVSIPLGTPESQKVLKQLVEPNVKGLYVIGTVSLSPAPIAMRDDVKNVPKTAFWGEVMRWYSYIPPQFYIEK